MQSSGHLNCLTVELYRYLSCNWNSTDISWHLHILNYSIIKIHFKHIKRNSLSHLWLILKLVDVQQYSIDINIIIDKSLLRKKPSFKKPLNCIEKERSKWIRLLFHLHRSRKLMLENVNVCTPTEQKTRSNSNHSNIQTNKTKYRYKESNPNVFIKRMRYV